MEPDHQHDQASVVEAKRLRRILPARHQQQPSGMLTGNLSRPRINPVTAACNACRRDKAKCSGERPSCHRCARRSMQCKYATRPGETRLQALNRNNSDLRSRATASTEIIELLKNLPEKDAHEVLTRLRSGTEPETILSHVKTGDLLLQMACLPETQLRYEFPYRPSMPRLYTVDNPYLDSIIYETTSLYSRQGQGTSSIGDHISPARSETLSSEEYQSLYLKPFHAAVVVDPHLSDAKPSSWTTVCSDDMLMRELLAAFFRCEYQFTAAFQKDLFLEDMAAGEKDFCSSLLVNIVLAISCVCYSRFSNRAEYWNPNTFTYRFTAEAKRLWELEATEAQLTTVQAGILFSVFHNLCGLDEIGQPYRIHGVALALQLGLLDASLEQQSERLSRGWAFTAWALFNWETLVAFSFLHQPLIEKAPEWPLPDPEVDSEWYGETWMKYPLSHSLLPSYLGHVIQARSKFRIIMNAVCCAAFSKDSEMTLDQAHVFREKLQLWYNGLTEPLLPKTIVLPGHLQLHIYYHHLLLTIFEPFLDTATTTQPSPQRIVANAKKYLQTLVRLYYLRHGFEAMDLFIVIPLMLTAYDCLDAIDEQTQEPEVEDLRSTLILTAQGLYSQRRNHYLAKALFQVIRGRMRTQEADILGRTAILDEETPTAQEMVQPVRSHWPVSVVKKPEDLESHILRNLVKSYAGLTVDSMKDEIS